MSFSKMVGMVLVDENMIETHGSCAIIVPILPLPGELMIIHCYYLDTTEEFDLMLYFCPK